MLEKIAFFNKFNQKDLKKNFLGIFIFSFSLLSSSISLCMFYWTLECSFTLRLLSASLVSEYLSRSLFSKDSWSILVFSAPSAATFKSVPNTPVFPYISWIMPFSLAFSLPLFYIYFFSFYWADIEVSLALLSFKSSSWFRSFSWLRSWFHSSFSLPCLSSQSWWIVFKLLISASNFSTYLLL